MMTKQNCIFYDVSMGVVIPLSFCCKAKYMNEKSWVPVSGVSMFTFLYFYFLFFFLVILPLYIFVIA